METCRRIGKHRRPTPISRACRPVLEALENRTLLTALTIAQENALPGAPASQWDVSGAGDATIQGFATDISVNQGQTVSFKINDTAKASYHIDIYRMGYYQGNGARLVTSISSAQTLKQAQPAPITDSTTGLVDCGNWAVSASWAVPSDATSGIYFAKVIRDDTGGASHIVFIVRNDASHSNLLFQTSDSTWEAYNTWGPSGLNSGNSLYEENGNTSVRARKVSYNRPFTDRGLTGGLGSENWVFNAEYPMVRWLEANGYDVSYFTDMDGERYGALIKNHKVFMSVGHDEYWSGQQRANVAAARDAGVNLAFFSGNEMFWKTRWENSVDGSNTPYRTLVCYKETHDNAVTDPMDPPTWTGTWRDPRFSPPADGGLPENQLTGTIFTVNVGVNDVGSPMSVPASDAGLRFWRNTTVANLQPGQTASLGTYVLGYEWDEDLDNGFRPAGLIDMSSTTQTVQQRIEDYGNNFGPGTATHSLTLYRASSGALVFGAGTVQWSWGLDSNHDAGASPPDPAIQQATVNLFADMGVQPTTLQSGLIAASASTDTIAPTSHITSPLPNASVQGGATYTITGTASDSGGGVVAGVEVSTDGGLTWHPAAGRNNWTYSWTPNSLATATIMSRATDDSANTEKPSAGVTVNVSGPISIWNASTTPVSVDDDDSSATELGVKFRSDVAGFIDGIRFYKGPTNTGTHVGDLWSSTGTRLATATFSGESASGWQTVRFSSPVPINPNTTYIAAYHTNVGHYAEDDDFFLASGRSNGPLHALANGVDGPNSVYVNSASSAFPTNTYLAANYWVDVLFETSNASDTTPPTVTNETPVPNASNVSATTAPTATFSEPVQSATISFALKDSGGNSVPGSVSYNTGSNVATFTPGTSLATLTMYTATVSGAKDLSGNLMTPVSWSFTTAAPIGPGPYSLWAPTVTPTAVDDPDASATEVGVKIRTDLGGTISGIRFYKGPTNTGTHVGDLWSSTGTLLATATFTNESSTGWQQVNFSTPVTIQPNTTYIAAYHTNVGHYAEDDNYFVNAGVDNGPLHALQAGVDGFNGVYGYSASSIFPTQNWLSANYWVDVVFNPNFADTTPPTVTGETPAPNATGVATSSTVSATFSESIQPATLSFVLKDAGNNVVASTVSYVDATHTATLTPSAALAPGATYTATVSGAKDLAGNQMTAPFSWSFTTIAPDTTPPTVTAQSPAPNSSNVSVGTAVTATFSEAVQPGTISFLLKDSANNAVAATLTYSATTNTATLAPSASLNPSTTYTATVSGAADLAGNVMTAPVSWSFTTIVADTTPPTVTAEAPAPNATGVGTNSTVTAIFSESIQSATLSFVLKDASNNTVAAAVSYTDTTHTATLTPTSALNVGTTYTATVSGAKDLAGNVMTAPVTWSFTTVNQWKQTTVADFTGGTQSNTVVTNTSGGEVQLATSTDDFTGTTLSTGWTTKSWASLGGGPASTTVANSILSLGGEMVSSGTVLAGTPVEAQLAFAAVAYQHFGLATDLASVSGNSWVIFSTLNTTNTLFARVNVNGATQDVSLGALPTGFHDYRIQPSSNTYQFYVDGALKTTLTATIPSGTALKAVFSEFAGSPQPPMQVDWVRYGTYASNGVFISSVFDAGRIATWGIASWTANLPAGTNIIVETSSGNTATPDSTWSAWQTVTNGGMIASPPARYLRYRITLTTSSPTVTPVLQDITINWA